MINSADAWYARHRPDVSGRAGGWLDLGFFYTTRVFDFAFGHFRTCPEQRSSRSWAPWLLPLPMLVMLAWGAVHALRGGSGPLVRRWVACFVVMLVLCVGLSGLRAFPLGGIRQLIALSPLVVLTTAAAFDARSPRSARTALAAGLLWAVASAVALPKYYQTTRDGLSPEKLTKLAVRYGVKHVVSGDTLCSIGAPRIHNALGPKGDVLTSDDPRYVEMLKQHKPFLLFSLFDPILEKTGDAIEPSGLYKFLAHPLATLGQFRATPVIRPDRRIAWLEWTVYLVEPKPGPYAPKSRTSSRVPRRCGRSPGRSPCGSPARCARGTSARTRSALRRSRPAAPGTARGSRSAWNTCPRTARSSSPRACRSHPTITSWHWIGRYATLTAADSPPRTPRRSITSTGESARDRSACEKGSLRVVPLPKPFDVTCGRLKPTLLN